MSDGNRNHNRNLRISRAPLKSQAHQGTSLFKSAVHGKHRSEMVSSGPNGSVRNTEYEMRTLPKVVTFQKANNLCRAYN